MPIGPKTSILKAFQSQVLVSLEDFVACWRVEASLFEESMDKVVGAEIDAAKDVVSPFKEIAGLIGDKMKAYRDQQAIANYLKIKDFAKECGLTFTLPPTKFLIPFTEQASLEDLSEPALTEMWTSLLLNSEKY